MRAGKLVNILFCFILKASSVVVEILITTNDAFNIKRNVLK